MKTFQVAVVFPAWQKTDYPARSADESNRPCSLKGSSHRSFSLTGYGPAHRELMFTRRCSIRSFIWCFWRWQDQWIWWWQYHRQSVERNTDRMADCYKTSLWNATTTSPRSNWRIIGGRLKERDAVWSSGSFSEHPYMLMHPPIRHTKKRLMMLWPRRNGIW